MRATGRAGFDGCGAGAARLVGPPDHARRRSTYESTTRRQPAHGWPVSSERRPSSPPPRSPRTVRSKARAQVLLDDLSSPKGLAIGPKSSLIVGQGAFGAPGPVLKVKRHNGRHDPG